MFTYLLSPSIHVKQFQNYLLISWWNKNFLNIVQYLHTGLYPYSIHLKYNFPKCLKLVLFLPILSGFYSILDLSHVLVNVNHLFIFWYMNSCQESELHRKYIQKRATAPSSPLLSSSHTFFFLSSFWCVCEGKGMCLWYAEVSGLGIKLQPLQWQWAKAVTMRQSSDNAAEPLGNSSPLFLCVPYLFHYIPANSSS